MVVLDAHTGFGHRPTDYTRMPDRNESPERLDSRILAGIEQINNHLERQSGGSGKAGSIVLTDAAVALKDAAVALKEDEDKWSSF